MKKFIKACFLLSLLGSIVSADDAPRWTPDVAVESRLAARKKLTAPWSFCPPSGVKFNDSPAMPGSDVKMINMVREDYFVAGIVVVQDQRSGPINRKNEEIRLKSEADATAKANPGAGFQEGIKYKNVSWGNINGNLALQMGGVYPSGKWFFNEVRVFGKSSTVCFNWIVKGETANKELEASARTLR